MSVHPRAVDKLQTLVRIATVSNRDPGRVDSAAFDLFRTELARLFPLLHEHLELTRISTHGLLFHWSGRAQVPATAAGRPVVLMAHLDVVPVEGTWRHDAFGAAVVEHLGTEAIWGRGTLDDKGALVGICEAVEELLAGGSPRPRMCGCPSVATKR